MRKVSSKQEKQVARKVWGKQVSNSGATSFHKGDVASICFLYECKTRATPQKSITIKQEWLDKLEEERFAMNKDHGVLVVSFGDGKNYYIMDERTFLELKGDRG